MKHYFSLRGPFYVKEVSIYVEKCSRASEGYNFYYVLEDLLKERLAGKVAWSVLRLGSLMGSSIRTLYNILGCLGINGVAEQHICAATNDEISSRDGQAFNAINGPSFTWKEIWPVLGKKFGAEVPK
ncbi:hypothetical protein Peur_001998 [Populus x canadensis]